jgi:hypothetical protein
VPEQAVNDKTHAIDALAHRIDEAVGRVHDDVDRVEFWAVAVSGCAQPIPGYPFDLPAKDRAA